MSTKKPRPSSDFGCDLSRRFLIDVSADGACFVRDRGEKMAVNGLLPVFSTDDRESANGLIVRYCTLARDGSGIYRLNRSLFDPDLDEAKRVEQLLDVADEFRRAYSDLALQSEILSLLRRR